MLNVSKVGPNTQETYLGRDMQDAIQNEAEGRWPIGLETLENILGKQGNMVTADDMLLLRRNHPNLYNRAKNMCYAVRTCQPDPNLPGGGCSRKNNPGVQGFNSGGIYSLTPFFYRGRGYSACSKCPAGNPAQQKTVQFRQESIDIGQPRQNVINTTDLLSFSINRSPGKKHLDIKLSKDGHTIKWDKPGDLNGQDILDKFEDLAIYNSTVDLDVRNNQVVYDSPLESSEFSIDFVLGKSNQPPLKTNLVTFSDQRIRYFVGDVKFNQALQKFTERIPRGDPAYNIAVRLSTDDSLIAWLPSPPGANNTSNKWEERLGSRSEMEAREISQPGKVQFFLIDKYPGCFLFVKDSKQIIEGNKIRKFLTFHSQSINPQILVPRFYQDTNSIRFFWSGINKPTTNFDEGGYPEFYLDKKPEICLLLQLSGRTTFDEGEIANTTVSFPTVELAIIGPNTESKILAKLGPDEFGFAWCKFKFQQDGMYQLGFRNTQNQRTRWVIVNVDSKLSSTNSPTYLGEDGNYHQLDSGKNWGTPSTAEKREVFQSNKDKLFQGIDLNDFPFDPQKLDNLSLGHVAEISRLIFHKRAKPIGGSKCMTLTSFSNRVRRITYNISNLYGISHNPDDDLIKVIKSLGEFEYWEREPDWENKHYIRSRRTTSAEIKGITELKILFDSKPYKVLKDNGIDIFTDWKTGLRYIINSKPISNAETVILHPNEIQILPSALLQLVEFWNNAEDFAEPMNISPDMNELRWQINKKSIKMPVNKQNIDKIATNLLGPSTQNAGYNSHLLAREWLKLHNWYKASSIEIDQQRRLFISIRVPKIWNFSSGGEPPWELYLGCLYLHDMSEKVLSIDSTDLGILPYVDELGNIGMNKKLKMPWLVDPRSSSLYDRPYLTREIIRSFASICLDNAKDNSDILGNLGIPGWVFQRDKAGQDLIHIRADSIRRMARNLVDEDRIKLNKIPDHTDLKRDISIAVKRRFWW